MAKSSLSGSRLKLPKQDSISTLPSWKYELTIDNITVSVDLQRLTHHLCAPSNPKKDRQHHIARYAYAFKQELKRKAAHATLYSSFLKFKQYLVWCDQHYHYPFSESAWKQYHEHLWQLTLTGTKDEPVWLLAHGETTGIKESSARIFFSTVEQALSWCGENAFQWGKQLRQIRLNKPKSHEAYSEKELPVILNRLSSYFFQLSLPLLRDNPPEKISVEINQIPFDVPVISHNIKGRAKDAVLSTETAFNQAMACGYYLLSYFTAFNTSQLTDLCHPIEWQENKTGEYYKLTAFKRRANKDVLSLVGGEMHKKSLQFIETLIALSLKYAGEESGNKLLYWLERDGHQRNFSSLVLPHIGLSNRLLLLSDRASMCIPYLMDIHARFMATSPKSYVEFDEVKVVNRIVVKRKKIVRRFYNRRVITLSFALLQAIIEIHPKNRLKNINLRSIVLPLTITPEGADLKVDFLYENDDQGTFHIYAQYRLFLNSVEKYAITRQEKQALVAHYLLPLGTERNATQWQGLAPNMKHLSDYGIHTGQFFVNLTASRFRETAAKLARRKANRADLHVSQILNNQYRTVLKHYSEGNRYDNQLIMSQGLAVIERMSRGSSLDQSKLEVATELSIPVIKFDELIGNQASLNGVGVGCFQQPPEDGQTDQACFDYESCLKCQYAKLINDVEPLYRLLSFLECMEESWLYYPERFSRNLGKTIELYRKIISSALSPEVIRQAQLKLDTEGRHMLWDNLELSSLGYKGI